MSPVVVTQGNTSITVDSPVQTNVETHSQQRVDVQELGIVGGKGDRGDPGTPGAPGAPGRDGVDGAPGASALNPIVFQQMVPATEWTITHSLNTFPLVSVVDSANQQVFGTVLYPDVNTVILSFEHPFSGTAYLL